MNAATTAAKVTPFIAGKGDKVKLLASRKVIQITPGLAVQPAPLSAVPAFAVVEWHRKADGSYEPKLVTHEQWIKLSDHPADELGIPVGRKTLLRLARAGFIRVRRPTPFEYQLHLGSLIEHLEAAEEEDFWTPGRVEQYRSAL